MELKPRIDYIVESGTKSITESNAKTQFKIGSDLLLL